MAEYIDREKVLALGYWHGEHPDFDNPNPDGVDAVDVSNIEAMPAADVAEVVHGQWCVSKIRSIETVFYCSECKRTVTVGNDFFGEAPQSVSAAYPYCHCGAKMDGGNGT